MKRKSKQMNPYQFAQLYLQISIRLLMINLWNIIRNSISKFYVCSLTIFSKIASVRHSFCLFARALTFLNILRLFEIYTCYLNLSQHVSFLKRCLAYIWFMHKYIKKKPDALQSNASISFKFIALFTSLKLNEMHFYDAQKRILSCK